MLVDLEAPREPLSSCPKPSHPNMKIPLKEKEAPRGEPPSDSRTFFCLWIIDSGRLDAEDAGTVVVVDNDLHGGCNIDFFEVRA